MSIIAMIGIKILIKVEIRLLRGTILLMRRMRRKLGLEEMTTINNTVPGTTDGEQASGEMEVIMEIQMHTVDGHLLTHMVPEVPGQIVTSKVQDSPLKSKETPTVLSKTTQQKRMILRNLLLKITPSKYKASCKFKLLKQRPINI